MQINPDGSLDSSFATDAGLDAAVGTLGVQSDGRILVGGPFTTFRGEPRDQVARLNADGTLDPSFIPPAQPASTSSVLVLRPDGSVIIGRRIWDASPTIGILQLTASGAADPSFSPAEIRSGAVVSALLRQPNGQLLIGGNLNFVNNQRCDAVARLNPDASLDPSFHAPSRAASPRPTRSACNPTAGCWSAGGFSTVNGTPQRNLTRLDSDGTLDTAFNPDAEYPDGFVTALALFPDERVLVAGRFLQYGSAPRSAMVRLGPDGSLDDSFDPANLPHGAAIRTILPQHDNRILICDESIGVRRLNDDGSPDLTFAGTFGNGGVATILPAPNGKFYVTAVTSIPPYFLPVSRMNADGTPESDYYQVGAAAHNLAKLGTPSALYLQADGRLIAGQAYNSSTATGTPPIGLGRLFATGAEDATLSVAGLIDGGFSRIVMMDDGSLLVSGSTFFDGQRVQTIDLADDIVQVEFSGAGTLTILLDDSSDPDLPRNYNQHVLYMKGHAPIVLPAPTRRRTFRSSASVRSRRSTNRCSGTCTTTASPTPRSS